MLRSSFLLYFLNLFMLIVSPFCSFFLILVHFIHVILHYYSYVSLCAFLSSSLTHSFLFSPFLFVFLFIVSLLSLIILYGGISFQFLYIIFLSVSVLFPSSVFALLFLHVRWATSPGVVQPAAGTAYHETSTGNKTAGT